MKHFLFPIALILCAWLPAQAQGYVFDGYVINPNDQMSVAGAEVIINVEGCGVYYIDSTFTDSTGYYNSTLMLDTETCSQMEYTILTWCADGSGEQFIATGYINPGVPQNITTDLSLVCGGNTDCSVSFSEEGELYNAYVAGGTAPYTYNWSLNDEPIGDGGPVISLGDLSGDSLILCLEVIDANGNTCSYCQWIEDESGEDCEVYVYANGDGMLYAEVDGEQSPYSFVWSTGETTPYIDVSDLDSGYHTFQVTAMGTDSSFCYGYYQIYVNEDDGCLDWTVIDLSEADCNWDYEPVCGCDGLMYQNACVAYYCYGVLEWTDGPCDYSQGGNGEPVDSFCNVSADFDYYAEMNQEGGFDIHVTGYGEDVGSYVWSMGGDTEELLLGSDVSYTYGATDSIQAYTICLTTYSATDTLCWASICETVVFDSTPNGVISGTVVEGNGDGQPGIVARVNQGAGDGDEPIAEMTVELRAASGAVLATTTTDADGRYEFSGLQFGDYFVYVVLDGSTHSADPVSLSPVSQGRDDLDYGVNDGQVLLAGTDDVSFASGISVSPNPTHGGLNIRMELHESADMSILVTDMTGKTIRQRSQSYAAGNQNIELNVTDLPEGLYFVSIRANGEVFTRKVIKR